MQNFVYCNPTELVFGRGAHKEIGMRMLPWAKDGKKALVMKESYGNAFVPFLTSHYGRIIVIDPREFNRDGKPSLNLAEFAADQGVDDLIVINYPYMINSKAFIRYLNALAGVQ